jgi:hypothetical protein
VSPAKLAPQMFVSGQRAFTSMEVTQLAGLSYRQLDYAVRVGRVRPSIDEGAGSGHVRLFSARDVVKARLVRLTTPLWGFPPAWQEGLLARLDVIEVGDLVGQLVVITEDAADLVTLERFADQLPLFRSLVTVIPCDQLLRGVVDPDLRGGAG